MRDRGWSGGRHRGISVRTELGAEGVPARSTIPPGSNYQDQDEGALHFSSIRRWKNSTDPIDTSTSSIEMEKASSLTIRRNFIDM